jgi:hypothetical protein
MNNTNITVKEMFRLLLHGNVPNANNIVDIQRDYNSSVSTTDHIYID